MKAFVVLIAAAVLAWANATNRIRAREVFRQPQETRFNVPDAIDLERLLSSQDVVGGDVVLSADTPAWFVYSPAVEARQATVPQKRCGGSLVSANTVVTAAHCYDNCSNTCGSACDDPCPTSVVVGGSTRYNGIVRGVVPGSCRIHPQYKEDADGKLTFDVATYKLVDPVNLAKYATLPPDSNFPGVEYSGDSGRVGGFFAYGFGRFSNNANSGSERLKVMNVTYWFNCEAQEGGELYEATHHVCALQQPSDTDPDEGACDGDSGGPLVYKEGNIDYLVGITSFFDDIDCGSGKVDYFARVGTYKEWIQEQINTGNECGSSASALWEKSVKRVGQLLQHWH